MKSFYSLSRFPGKTGEGFYNAAFKRHGVNFTYTALPCSDLRESINEIILLNGAGVSISMPFKKEVIELLDYKDELVNKFQSCNTVVINDRKLHGYNTDYYGCIYIQSLVEGFDNVSILGNGSMGTMIKTIIGDKAKVYARRLGNWNERNISKDVIINCTSFGTSVADSPFTELPETALVIDLALKPNQLEHQCSVKGVKYVNGIEFYKRQFVHQYKIYTDKALTLEEL